MSYQYGQGFENDLKSLVKLVKKENTIDFDPTWLDGEIKKIIKYNVQKIIIRDSEKAIIEEFNNLSNFVTWFNKWDELYNIEIKDYSKERKND